MNKPPLTDFQISKQEQANKSNGLLAIKLQELWSALREACAGVHEQGAKAFIGKKCVCGKGPGHGGACAMLSMIRNHLLTCSTPRLRSYEVMFVRLLRDAIVKSEDE